MVRLWSRELKVFRLGNHLCVSLKSYFYLKLTGKEKKHALSKMLSVAICYFKLSIQLILTKKDYWMIVFPALQRTHLLTSALLAQEKDVCSSLL